MEAKQLIEDYVSRHYGNLTMVGRIKEEPGRFVAELRTDYPRWIKDEKSTEPILRYIPMDAIGQVVFDSNMNVIQATTRAECGQKIWDRLDLWKIQAERIMVEASADRLAMAKGADQFLSPVTIILDNLKNPVHGRPLITRAEVQASDPNWLKYLALLAELDIVTYLPEEKGWTYGSTFVALEKKASEKEMEFARVVFAHLLKNRYPTIRDNFRINIFEKSIHLDSSYYWLALDAEEPVTISRLYLFSRYKFSYGDEEASDMALNSTLQELSRIHAIKSEKDNCVAEEELLKEMIVLKLAAGQGRPTRA